MRTFGLNSREFYEAVCEPRERPWIPNGSLPREPITWGQSAIVEARAQRILSAPPQVGRVVAAP
ncbi:MAG: hypothetical protein QOE50_1394 [Sphingomonadales bacterium]|jgi:hypothetical protein|nr:hypothetical protein [Sphingomonadales bacterium]